MEIDFYEKPGCINNTKQKKLLEDYGHKVNAFSLLTQPWSTESLRPFFGDMPVVDWFNVSAPAIKSGEVDPSSFTEESALAAMVKDPLLIRRPLIRVNETKVCGFKGEFIESLLEQADVSHLQSCPKSNNKC